MGKIIFSIYVLSNTAGFFYQVSVFIQGQKVDTLPRLALSVYLQINRQRYLSDLPFHTLWIQGVTVILPRPILYLFTYSTSRKNRMHLKNSTINS